MSYNIQRLLTNNQLNTDYDLSKVFILNNRYLSGSYTNSGYTPVSLPIGTVMGRVTTTGEIHPLISSANDGSQIPVGILAQDYIIQPGAQTTLMYCVCGDVASEEIGFINGTDTLATVVSGRQLQDRIAGDTVGIILKAGLDLTDWDNPNNP